MKAFILKCAVHNFFRLGIRSMNDTHSYIYSDTLFSAILSTHAKMYGRKSTDELCELFTSGQVACSSGFHCLSYSNPHKEEDFIYFLPRPLIYLATPSDDPKSLKDIQFLSKKVWENGPSASELLSLPRLGSHHVISWEELEALNLQPRRKDREAIQLPELTKEITYPKVHVRKEGQEDAYFTQTCLQLKSFRNLDQSPLQTHFYFLLKGEIPASLFAAIRMLADEGIGGERSSGMGHFKGVEEREFSTILPNPNYQCTLSLSIPKSEIDFQSYEKFQLIIRGGGSMASENSASKTVYRKQLRMIQEGAMIPSKAPYPNGTCPEIGSPGKNVPRRLRYGIPFTLPFNYHG